MENKVKENVLNIIDKKGVKHTFKLIKVIDVEKKGEVKWIF